MKKVVQGKVDYAMLADAIHETVCTITEDSGVKWCLTYAIMGAAWLNRYSGVPHACAGGQIAIPLKGHPTVLFEHFWVMRGEPGNWTFIDFATRHNPAILREGAAKHGAELAPDAFDEKVVGMPFYVGNGDDVKQHWQYYVVSETSIHAHKTYEQADKRTSLIDWHLAKVLNVTPGKA